MNELAAKVMQNEFRREHATNTAKQGKNTVLETAGWIRQPHGRWIDPESKKRLRLAAAYELQVLRNSGLGQLE